MAVDKKERKKALIIDNSMVKVIKRWRLNTSDMKQYTKPPLKKNTNAEVVIIQTGTNDLSSNLTPTKIV